MSYCKVAECPLSAGEWGIPCCSHCLSLTQQSQQPSEAPLEGARDGLSEYLKRERSRAEGLLLAWM